MTIRTRASLPYISPDRAPVVWFLTFWIGIASEKEHKQKGQIGWVIWPCVVCVDRSQDKCNQVRKASFIWNYDNDIRRQGSLVVMCMEIGTRRPEFSAWLCCFLITWLYTCYFISVRLTAFMPLPNDIKVIYISAWHIIDNHVSDHYIHPSSLPPPPSPSCLCSPQEEGEPIVMS